MPTPFDGEQFTFTNPDGSTLQVRGWGNQFSARFETLDGFTVVKDPDSGFYRYASLSDDEMQYVATDVDPRSDEDPQSLGLQPHVRVQPEVAKRDALTAAGDALPQRWQQRRQERKRPPAGRSALVDAAPAPPPGATVGTYVGLCLLIEFPDVPQTIAQAEVDRYCNQVGYTGFGNNGSVRDYFLEVSDQRLTYTNIVTAYYTAAHNRAYYTDPSIAYGTRARELIREALDDLVADGFTFSGLSSDASGYIYALNVFYAQTNVNNWAEGLWPHSSGLGAPYNVGGGKRFNDYQFTDMGAQLTLGTFCHENGHMICDFPDLYDYGYESRGAGTYSLMAFGNFGTNPVHVDAYLKHEAGWTSRLTTVNPGMTATVSAGMNDFVLYPKGPTEYFIIENRQQAGRDALLPDAGLAIWHVDTQGSNNNEQMTPAQHYELSIEQADGRFDLEHQANSGDGTDLFGAPQATRFADDTAPDSHWWDGGASGLVIEQISASGAVMTFTTPGPHPSGGLTQALLLDEEPDITPQTSVLLG